MGSGYEQLRFSYLVSNRTGATELNYGIGGTTIAVRSGATNSFIERYPSMDSTADYIFVLGGTNDYDFGVPMGTMAGTSDTTTFYGALHTLIKGLISMYPYKKIYFGTPTPRHTVSANSVGYVFSDYVNAVRQVCTFYGVAFVDFNATCPFSKNSAGESQYLKDYVHPNAQGNSFMAELIFRLFCFSLPNTDPQANLMPALPTDSSTKTYSLKAVNGVISWVEG
jgi:lysophospholipase L1-like esterase